MIHLKSLKSFKTMDFFLGKEKPSPLEFQKFIDCLEYLKNIEVYESSDHEEEETFPDVDEIEHFFLILLLPKRPTMKENSIFKFSTCIIRRLRILTYG